MAPIMYILGITLVVIGFGSFVATTLYYALDYQRTRVLYRSHRKILFPVLIVAFVIAGIGGFTVAGANGHL